MIPFLSTREDENAEHALQYSDDRTEQCEPERQPHFSDGMTFRMHDDSSPFVKPFGIDREQRDYQHPQDRHRDHGLVLLHPQNDLPARVAALT
jgi:pimeloyl-ACP methyl ester carboxylesterase